MDLGMVAIDGTEALFAFVVRPHPDGGLEVETFGRGMPRLAAVEIMRDVADRIEREEMDL
jgi:hypothetical protein